jgi:hypothetical protein
MTPPAGVTRRGLFMKIGIFLNGIVAVILGVPIVRYLLSPVVHERKGSYDSWVPLGSLEQFPSGQTRLATYRDPVVSPTDGETADIACWVRNIDGQSFQVFAINCAHLGCPVRWFPNPTCSCARAMVVRITRTAPAPPARPNADCSNTITRSMAGSC